ncbi:unnamed protein product, partial [Scytosiphon promiscuus]
HNIHSAAISSDTSTAPQNYNINVENQYDVAPTDITFEQNSGVKLNSDGSNNTKMSVADSGDIVGGLTSMTLETQFSSTNDLSLDGDYMALFSYHAGGGSDEIELSFDNNGGELQLSLEIGEQTVYTSGYDTSQLLDGGDHQVSVTWDNVSGEWSIYVDGAVVESGTGLATGHTIASGGMIVLGQEQDNLDGGYDSNQEFVGTYQDVRIFNDVRTAQEIADNANIEISED